MTETREPRTIKELRETAERIDKLFREEVLTVEEVLIVIMMTKETAAANLAARAVMDKISTDMSKVRDMVESGNVDVRVVELKPPKEKKLPVMPPSSSNN
jgi:hypothetical protein